MVMTAIVRERDQSHLGIITVILLQLSLRETDSMQNVSRKVAIPQRDKQTVTIHLGKGWPSFYKEGQIWSWKRPRANSPFWDFNTEIAQALFLAFEATNNLLRRFRSHIRSQHIKQEPETFK